jgi:hypothetical protein
MYEAIALGRKTHKIKKPKTFNIVRKASPERIRLNQSPGRGSQKGSPLRVKASPKRKKEDCEVTLNNEATATIATHTYGSTSERSEPQSEAFKLPAP